LLLSVLTEQLHFYLSSFLSLPEGGGRIAFNQAGAAEPRSGANLIRWLSQQHGIVACHRRIPPSSSLVSLTPG